MDEDVLMSSVSCRPILTCRVRCGVDVLPVLELLFPPDALDPLVFLDL